jgi:hexosaminidase
MKKSSMLLRVAVALLGLACSPLVFSLFAGKGLLAMESPSLPLIPAPRAWTPTEGTLATSGAVVTEKMTGQAPAPFTGAEVPGIEAESYRLEISSGGIHITASDPAGVFRARQTVRQLLESGRAEIPCGVIEDSPRYRWRGMLLDCGRHFMPLDVIKRAIDQLALHKFNVLHWHLTEDQGWRLEVPGYPKLTEVAAWRTQTDGTVYGGYYTEAEVREIVAYAAERFMVVVPEIELPGHSVAALAAYPELSCTGGPFAVETQWGVHHDVYCAGNEQVFTFLEDVFSWAMELFPSVYLHIGGDECPKERWMACPRCQQRIKDEGLADEHELQSWFIRRMETFLNGNGRRIIGWDEILEGGLAPNATVQSWRGVRGAIAAARSGHQAIVSPTSHCYFDYDVAVTDLRQVYTFDPVPAELNATEAELILGGEMNLWSEYIPPERLEKMVFPRAAAMAECLWTADPERDFLEFAARVEPHLKWLESLGVSPGPSARPLRVEAEFDPETRRHQLKFTVDEKLREALKDELEVRWRRLPQGTAFDPAVLAEEQELPAVQAGDEPFTHPVEVGPTPGSAELVAAQVFLAGKPYGAPGVAQVTGHLATGIAPVLAHPASSRYPGGGPHGLTNGLHGGQNYRDGLWSGFEATNLDAVIDLGESRDLKSLQIGCYQGATAWIFLPEKVEFFLSDDGQKWRLAASVGHDISNKIQRRIIHRFVTEVKGQRARYVRVVAHSLITCPAWHPGAGGPCWVFADEIVVE